MTPETYLASLIVVWHNAVGITKDIAFAQIIIFIKNNEVLAQSVINGNGPFIAQLRQAITAVAGGAIAVNAARPAFSVFLARFTANFAISPKGPNPYLMVAVTAGCLMLTAEQAQAQGMEREAAYPSYELYVANYFAKMIQAKKFHPQNNAFASPKTFPEWYEENRQ